MTDPERYRLTLYLHGRPAMDGWWGLEATARRKFAETVGQHGGRDGARIILVDREDGGRVVAAWPMEP